MWDETAVKLVSTTAKVYLLFCSADKALRRPKVQGISKFPNGEIGTSKLERRPGCGECEFHWEPLSPTSTTITARLISITAQSQRDEIFQVLVVDPMMGTIEVDWRDFFPYLKILGIIVTINQGFIFQELLSHATNWAKLSTTTDVGVGEQDEELWEFEQKILSLLFKILVVIKKMVILDGSKSGKISSIRCYDNGSFFRQFVA
ncbi:cytochrome P450 [Artemisia annua]|uniref:Cytochrome P450 n=1 Tax=Artemisia annua TaxID=35608 RepID=A0A2U1KND1_ARTAN|nr:cytochrome P450 [Artemisia annua]